MTMDLMYGCSSEYDPTLEELLEVDLRSEMDRIIAGAKGGHPFEFMAELEFSASHFTIHEEGMDEIDIRFDSSRFDPYSLSSFGLTPIASHMNNSNSRNLKSASSQSHFSKNNNSSNSSQNQSNNSNSNRPTNTNSKTSNSNQNHHSNSSTSSSTSAAPGNNSNSSNGKNHQTLNVSGNNCLINIRTSNCNNSSNNSGVGQSQLVPQLQQNGRKVNVNVSVNGNGVTTLNPRILSSVHNSISNSSSNGTCPQNGIKQEFKPTIVTSLGSLNMGAISCLEDLGALVDPSSVVPVSVATSAASSASESDVDIGEFPTDEDESESEMPPSTNTVWVVPSRSHNNSSHQSGRHHRPSTTSMSSISSRSPSPNDLPEFELDEPEFIVTTGALHEVSPPKKRKQKHEPQPHTDGKIYPKPAFSYSCLIAMALKNSKTGSLPVSEIYKFMCDHFPYFKSAPSGWKNSVRHNLSLNKCFEKIEKPGNGARKGCLWALNPAKIHKMDEEVQKWSRKDPLAIRRAMSDPENLELIERGEMKRDYSGNGASDEDDEEDISEPCTPLTQAQLLARRSRGNSDSLVGETTTVSSTTPTTKVSQVHAISVNRPIEQKIHVKSEPMDTLDFGTITNVQGNYLCHTGAGTGTYTLSFSPLSNATTPIIIRRTPVK